jgi:hypothetical protein
MQGIHLRKYGVQTTIDFQLFEVDGVDFRVDAAHAAGDTKIMKDEGVEANTTNGFTDEGQGYSIVLTATEMQAARAVVYIVDSATKVWLDTSFVIETYGHASAMHAIDLDDSVRAGLTALPNAAAEAAGGLFTRGSGAGQINQDNNGEIDVDVQKWLGIAVATPTVGGVPEVDLVRMLGVQQSVTDLKDFADAGYDPAANKVQGVVLVDTTTTNTDMVTEPPTATAIVNEWETQSQADPTGFHVNVKEVNGTAQTANDNGADINTLITNIGTPANIDSGGATIADNLKKIADDNSGATFDATTDSQQAIRDRGDAAWTTGAGTGLSSLATGTAQAGAAGTITLAAGATATDNLYNGCRIATTGGTGAGQARIITDYNGTSKVATIQPNWITNPGADTTYEIQAAASDIGTIKTDGQSATDLKDFVDDGYDPSTDKVQGVVLVDTTTTNTDMVTEPPTAIQNRQEMDSNSTELAKIGTIPALDGAGQTVGEAIAKLADDNGGADFDATTDSQQAIRDRGDAAWITATGFNTVTPDAAGIAAALHVTTDALIAALNNLSAAQVNAEVDTALSDYDGPTKAEMDTAHALLATPAQVNTEVSDVIKTDTYTLPAQGAPSATPTLEYALMFLYKALRNKVDNDGTNKQIYADDGSTVDHKNTISDDGSTYTDGEWGTGP